MRRYGNRTRARSRLGEADCVDEATVLASVVASVKPAVSSATAWASELMRRGRCGVAHSGRGIVEFMGKPGCHRDQVGCFRPVFSLPYCASASPVRMISPEPAGRGAQQFQEASARQAKKPAVSDCSNEDRIRVVQQN